MVLRIKRFLKKLFWQEILVFLTTPAFYLFTYLFYKNGETEIMWASLCITILLSIGCIVFIILIVKLHMYDTEKTIYKDKQTVRC
jgi:hypothetical protein